MADRILRLPSTLNNTGLTKTVLYSKVKTGDFPAPVKLGERAVGWRESDIQAWIASRSVKGSAKAA